MSKFRLALDEIDKVDLLKDNAAEVIHNIIATKFKNLPIFGVDLTVNNPLVRSRYLGDKTDFHYDIQDYSYHPKPNDVKIGRANLPEQQIFYGSRYRETSLAEIRFLNAFREKKFARYSLGRWEVKQKLYLGAIVTPEIIRNNDAKELFGLADYIEKTEADLKNNKEIGDFLEVYKYFAKKYIEQIHKGEEHKYKITAVFSNFVYSKLYFPNGNITDGILYQSVQYPKHFNVALKKDVVDQNKIQLTFAARQNYIKTGNTEYKEETSIDAVKIDYSTNKIIWHSH